MSNIPAELRYTSTHEWVVDNGDGTVTIGITDHAQELLGDIVFVEAVDSDRELAAGEEYTVIESVKAASDSYAPINGTVIAFNEALEDAPETINEEPYTDGWIVKMQVADHAELDGLLDAEGYAEVVANEA
ncbi:MAG: glycine cleavage system protein GcvH [Gammaproteobacteria bacterium]|jgi:glycine cleavage system H protein|nr:glycine cleavage system protein GcvH [Gammaproteobacteria bacterium]